MSVIILFFEAGSFFNLWNFAKVSQVIKHEYVAYEMVMVKSNDKIFVGYNKFQIV